MKRRPKPVPVDLQQFDSAGPYQQNRLLLEWLSDDISRKDLFNATDKRGGVLEFPSLARDEEPPQLPRLAPDTGFRDAYLVTGAGAVDEVLRNPGSFSNSPYGAIGSGSFMLALDPAGARADRRLLQGEAARRVFACDPGDDQHPGEVGLLADHAFKAVLPTALARSDFDLAALAEEAALRFCSALFGYAAGDFPLLSDALPKGYQALNHQILGRHFMADPLVLPTADAALGRVLARTAELIDAYQLNRKDWPEDLEPRGGDLPWVEPVLKRLANDPGELTGEERALLAVGSLVGTVGNVQASVCIAIDGLLNGPAGDLQAAIKSAHGDGRVLWAQLAAALRDNPPVAFVPRRALAASQLGGVPIPADAQCIVAVGGATRHARDGPITAIFGEYPGHGGHPDHGVHACLGRILAEPLVRRICVGVLRLPSLAQVLDLVDGLPRRLEKQWGFRCLRQPLRHRRDLRITQQSLNVVMRIKTPTSANAEALRAVIRFGAPRIEAVLRESRHVHFAWFQFIDNDTRLVLHTVFDGDFNAYLQHFALVVGDVFDRLFRYIEGAPPLPVSDFPNEFVATIRAFHQPPAADFFFSAYPQAESASIRRWTEAQP